MNKLLEFVQQPNLRDGILSWIELIADVTQNADCAITVLNDLINYDKIMMNSLNLEYSSNNIEYLVLEAIKRFHIQALEKNIKINLVYKCNNILVEQIKFDSIIMIIDKIKISQVLNNLISNALKFTPSGIITVTIK